VGDPRPRATWFLPNPSFLHSGLPRFGLRQGSGEGRPGLLQRSVTFVCGFIPSKLPASYLTVLIETHPSHLLPSQGGFFLFRVRL